MIAFVTATMFVISVNAKDAKLMASWSKTLKSSSTVFQSAVNDSCGMLVTTLTTDPKTFATQSLTYAYYDKKDQEKLTGSFPIISGEDVWVAAICKKLVLVRRVQYSATSFTKLAKDYIEVYKLSKKGATLLGSVDLPLVNTYYNNISLHFDKNVIISVKDVDDEGNQTDNYIMIYDSKLKNSTTIQGTSKSDIITDSYQVPKYWTVKESTQTGSYPNTSTEVNIKIYK